MKLHLPSRLRASLIAALVAVPFSAYTARAVDYVAPSQHFGWNQNDITLTETYLKTAGNTYTATQTQYDIYEMDPLDPSVRKAYTEENGQGESLYFYGGSYCTRTGDETSGYIYTPYNGEHHFHVTGQGNEEARIIVEAASPTSGKLVSYNNGGTTLATNGTLEFRNTFHSGAAELEPGNVMAFQGNNIIRANSINIVRDSAGQGSDVVLEDADVTAFSPDRAGADAAIDLNSRLTILNGADTLSAEEKKVLKLDGVSFSDVDREKTHQVQLGQVTGKGSLAIVGNKTRTEEVRDDDGNLTQAAYERVEANNPDDGMTLSIGSITGQEGKFAQVSLANADAEVAGNIDATTLGLVNSVTRVGGKVDVYGLDVNKESVFTVEDSISQRNHQGAGHASLYGKVTAGGNIELANGKHSDHGAGIHEGATVSAGGNLTVSNLDATAAKELASGGMMRIGKNSTVNDCSDVRVSTDLVVENNSSINHSHLSVGDDILVTDKDPSGSVENPIGGSLIAGSRIDVTPTAGDPATVSILNGSEMRDSFIVGADGDILLAGSSADDKVKVGVSADSAAASDYIASYDEEGVLVDKKGNLANLLDAARATDLLTEDALTEAGFSVGSMIGNTSGGVTVKDAALSSTVVTADGSVLIGNEDEQAAAQTLVSEAGVLLSADPAADLDDLAARFGTAVDGSVIDVRGNLALGDDKLAYPATPANELKMASSSVTNTVVLGITSGISISDSLLDNNYIDGGTGLEIDNSVIRDTDFVNMTADIKIGGESNLFGSSSKDGFVLTTRGTAEIYDQDDYTGGSIILDGAALENGTIKSGVVATRNAEGGYDFTPATSESNAFHKTKGDLGVKLPYGDIAVTNSSLKNMTLTTVQGDVALKGTHHVTTPDVASDKANGIRGFTTSMNRLGATGETFLNNLTVMERANASNVPPARYIVLVIKESAGSETVIAESLNDVLHESKGKQLTFYFDNVTLNPEREYYFEFRNSDGTALDDMGVGLALDINDHAQAPTSGGSNWGAIVKTDYYTTKILASNIATERGGLSIDGALLDGTELPDGEATAYVKNTMTATDGGSITNSYVNGSDITVSEGNLQAGTGAVLRGDVNLSAVNGTLTLDGGADMVLDGDRKGEGTRDASVRAQDLVVADVARSLAALAHGQISVADNTFIHDGNALLLQDVNSAADEGSGQLGNVVERDKTEDGVIASLLVDSGSVVEAGRVYAGSLGSLDTADAASYFDHLAVLGDSSLKVQEQALIDEFVTFAGAPDGTGSKISFEKDAWLTRARIVGNGVAPALAEDGSVVGTEATVKMDAHIGRLSLEGEGMLNLAASTGAVTNVTSYIANIDEAQGTLNVSGETLVTPVVSSEELSLGLNGATVELASVSAEQGATLASENAVNPHVTVREITNASLTGAPDRTPVGTSTIRTELNRISTPYSFVQGEAQTVQGYKYYYVVTHDVTDPGTGTVLHKAGDIVVKDSVVLDTITLADGSQVPNGYHDGKGAFLTPEEETYLTRITVPVLDENGDLVYEQAGENPVLIVGQTVTEVTHTYYPEASETLGAVETMTDGIASLTVKGNMDSDKTVIKAYETGTVDPYGVTHADADTGYISIEGDLTGQENTLLADNDVSIKGILADGDADYENANTVVSNRGNVSIGTDGVRGSRNTLKALKGNVSIAGALRGNDNELTATLGHVATGDIAGDRNELTAGQSIATGSIEGDDNVLDAGTSIVADGSLKGDGNRLTAGTTIEVMEGILGDAEDASSDDNVLTAAGDIAIGATEGVSLAGSNNSVMSTEGDILLNGSLQGNDNELTATLGHVATGNIAGDRNELTAGQSIATGSIEGDENVLKAGTSIVADGSLKGDGNRLTAGTTIEVTEGILGDAEDASSDDNVLTASGDIAIGATEGVSLAGSNNSLTSGEGHIQLDGSIQGDRNELSAAQSIATGSIEGDENVLDAGTSLSVTGGVTGDHNVLTANDGKLDVTGTVAGAGNELAALHGEVSLGGLAGTDAGDPNRVTAAGRITVEGTLAGIGNILTTYSQGLSQDDVAFSVGVFAAQGTDLTIATTTSPEYGATNGNGSIVIGTMAAAMDAEGNLVEVDPALVNHIVSHNSFVMIGAMDDSNAYTVITAAKGIFVGTEGKTGDMNTASHLTMRAAELTLAGPGLALTDSSVTIAGSITGTSLSLTTTGTQVFAATASSVTLDSLSLGGYASLTATTVSVDNLTLDGEFATINATNLTVADKLTLKNGADLGINRVLVNELEIAGSTMSVTSLKGINILTLDDADLAVTAGLTGLSGDVTLLNNSSLSTSKIDIGGILEADNSELLVIGDVSSSALILRNDGELSGKKVNLGGKVELLAGSTLSGTQLTVNTEGGLASSDAGLHVDGSSVNMNGIDLNGSALLAANGGKIQGNVTEAGDVTLADSSVNGTVGMNGSLSVTNGSVGNVTGAKGAELSGATTGSLAMAENGDVTALAGTVVNGPVTNAGNVRLANSSVNGTVGMNGSLSVTNGSVGNVTGAKGAELSGATAGSLAMAENGDVTALAGTVVNGPVTNAGNVTLADSSVNGTVGMNGALSVTNGSIGNVTGAKGATLNAATAGSLAMSGALSVVGNSTVGDVTGADSAEIISSTVGDLTLNAGAANATVTVSGSVVGIITNADVIEIADSTVGSIAGSSDDRVQSITLTDSTLVDRETTLYADSLTTNGNVFTGSVDTGALTVNNGTLDAGKGFVHVSGETTLNNGEIIAGEFNTGTLTLVNVSGTVDSLNVTGELQIDGADTLNVKGTVHAGAIALDHSASLTAGDTVTTGGGVSLNNGAALSGTQLEVNAEGGLASGDTGLRVDGSTVTMNGIDMNGSALSAADGGLINGRVTNAGDVTIADSSVNGTIGMNGTLDVSNGSVADVTGANNATLNAATTGNLAMAEGGDVAALAGTKVNGSVTNAGDVTIADSSVNGTIGMNGALTVTNGSASDVTGADSATVVSSTIGDLTMNASATDATVTVNDSIVGTIANADTVRLTGSTASSLAGSADDRIDSVILTDSTLSDKEATLYADSLTTNGNVFTGAIDANSLTVNNGILDAGDKSVTVSGNTTLHHGEILAGAFQTGTLTLVDVSGTVDSLVVEGEFQLSGADTLHVTGKVEAGSIALSDGAGMDAGSTVTAGSIALDHGSLTAEGPIDVTGNVTLQDHATLNGTTLSVNNGGTRGGDAGLFVTGGSVVNVSDIDMNGSDLSLSDGGNVNASVREAGDVTIADSSVNGTVGMNGALAITNGSIGDVTGANNATLTSATTGNLAMADGGNVTASQGTNVNGSITGAGDLALSDTSTVSGDVSMKGDLALSGTASAGNVAGALSTTAEGVHTLESLETGDLEVLPDGQLTVNNDLTANGALAIAGTVSSVNGDIELTGTGDSAIIGSVTAQTGALTLDGEIDADGAELTAGGDLAVDGTLTAEETRLSGTNVIIDGTLNAEKSTVIDGTLQGTGHIEKTGSDTLRLAGDADFRGSLLVKESVLDAEDGAFVGKLTTEGRSEVVVANEGTIGALKAESVSLSNGTVVKADLDLRGERSVDTVTANSHDWNGATLELASLASEAESSVADQTRLTLAHGTVLSGANEDVAHNLDTLNVYADNKADRVDLVFSKNYKGANKTENQAQTAAGLASINRNAVAGTELGLVLDALGHTRSEADAKAALDSLSGRGLAGVQKLVTDVSKEHLQTLRTTLQSDATGIARRYDAAGRRLPDIQSSSLAAAVTGGTADLSDDGNGGKYTRNSLGFILSGVHAVSKEWTFGASAAYSYDDADSAETSISSDTVFMDVAMLQKRGRFTQIGTLGCALFSFETERKVRVAAKGHDYAGTAKGSTSATAFNLSYQAAYDYYPADNHTLSPVVMAEATFASIDNMAESGLGNAGLRSQFDDIASLTFGAGGRYTYTFGEERNPGYLMMEAMFVADAGDSTPKVDNRFIGGGSMFRLDGSEAGACGLRLNGGALMPLDEQWSLYGNVTAEFRSKQSNVGGSVGVKYAF